MIPIGTSEGKVSQGGSRRDLALGRSLDRPKVAPGKPHARERHSPFGPHCPHEASNGSAKRHGKDGLEKDHGAKNEVPLAALLFTDEKGGIELRHARTLLVPFTASLRSIPCHSMLDGSAERKSAESELFHLFTVTLRGRPPLLRGEPGLSLFSSSPPGGRGMRLG